MADCLLDTDIVIWHLRGHDSVVQRVLRLGERGRIGISVITRAEVMVGVRDSEHEATVAFLDACENLPVTPVVADEAARLVREARTRGKTLPLPDTLIGATALAANIPLYTGNVRHYPIEALEVRQIAP